MFFCVSFVCLVNGVAQSHFGSAVDDFIVDVPSSPADFPIFSIAGGIAPIRYDAGDFPGVVRAIGDLQRDVKSVTGMEPSFLTSGTDAQMQIVVGTLGRSAYIDQLVKRKLLDVSDVKGLWESFVISVIPKSKNNPTTCLVIAGSDKRGTIYGIYELSRQLGVSPWYWWADVPVKQRSSAYVLAGRYASGEPKVKYRGIFINDENPCMQRWARDKFGGMNSQMYAHMYELILRLRGNCLWPGMWGMYYEHKPLIPVLKDEQGQYLGNSFNEDDPENPRLANEYGIVVGTSHHEPMQRSQQEWIRNKANYGNGEWNYVTNKKGIQKFFMEGIENTKNFESLITMGMRGDDDKPMVDAGSAEANFRIVEGIMADQRKIIADVAGKSASNLQQVWTLYSEVLDYYDQGMKVPDDVIVMLCDNNWGDVRRLPEPGAKKHPGGYGMYYHVAYYGAPRASKWLNITQLQQMWEQLHLTYEYGVDKIWMLNVGDLKPNEYPMDFFMNMAWNPEAFTVNNLEDYSQSFCAQQLGETHAPEAARILNTYCKYASRIFPEMLDHKTFNLEAGEFKLAKSEFVELEARALRQFVTLPVKYHDVYKQLVLYPVQAMANLYDMYYAVAMNRKLAAEKDIAANIWADRVEACFVRDSLLSYDYNHVMANGKWKHMMDQPHIGYTTWHGPEFNTMPKVVRLTPNEAKQGGYIFSEKNGVVVMESEHYAKAKSTVQTQWTVIPDMGRTLSGMALMPYTQSTTGAFLSYKMKFTPKTDSVNVWVYFDSTMPFVKGGHRVAISFDGGKEQVWDLNSDMNWQNVYTKMYPAGAARMIEKSTFLTLPVSTDGTYTLTIRPLNPGVVVYKVAIDNGGYERTFLKMDESPYVRE